MPTGLVAAALLAVAPRRSHRRHYVKHDVPATLAIVVALWRLACCWPEGGATGRVPARDLGLAAVACGVAWSTHYYSVSWRLPLVATAVDARRREGWGGVVDDLGRGRGHRRRHFLRAVAVSAGRTGDGMARHRGQPSDRRRSRHRSRARSQTCSYAELLVGIGATLPVAAASAIGTVLLIATDRRRALLLLSFPVPFLLFIGNTVPASRYLNPVLPFVALTAAVAFRRLSRCWPRDVRAGCWPC